MIEKVKILGYIIRGPHENFTDYLTREGEKDQEFTIANPDMKIAGVRIWYANHGIHNDVVLPCYLKIPYHTAITLWIDSSSEQFFAWISDERCGPFNTRYKIVKEIDPYGSEDPFELIRLLMTDDIIQILPFDKRSGITSDMKSFGYKIDVKGCLREALPIPMTFEKLSLTDLSKLIDDESQAEWRAINV